MDKSLIVRNLGLLPYEPTWQKMQAFTQNRTPDTVDEIWVLQHEPVFTQGQAGKDEHIINTGDIPVVQVDRGGQITYHGPGQIVVYLLIDLRRNKLGVRKLVSLMEEAIITALEVNGIRAYAKADAPGVYVDNAKIASLGLRVKKGASFHGLALNFDMDMEPFLRINPCGYAGMAMTQVKTLSPEADMEVVVEKLTSYLIDKMGYTLVSNNNILE